MKIRQEVLTKGLRFLSTKIFNFYSARILLFFLFFFPKKRICREFLLVNSRSCYCSKEFSWTSALVIFQMSISWTCHGCFFNLLGFSGGFSPPENGDPNSKGEKERELNSCGISLLLDELSQYPVSWASFLVPLLMNADGLWHTAVITDFRRALWVLEDVLCWGCGCKTTVT